MSYSFSPSTKGFYLTSVHGALIPSDAIALTDAEYNALHAAQAAGKRIDVNEAGRPVAVDPPAPDAAFQWRQHQYAARAALDASDITLLRCIEHGVAVPPAWAAYRADLRGIISAPTGDSTAALPARPSYPVGS